MTRRLWFFAAVLAALSIFPAVAGAKTSKKHAGAHVIGGARHLGKPARHQLIAVRHGKHITWYSKTHGLAKTKLPTIKLSTDARFLRLSTRAFGPTAQPVVTAFGACPAGSQSTPNGSAYTESYGGLYADVLNCVGNNGGHTESNAYFPTPTCSGPGQSVTQAPLELATFTDGEWMAICSVPDDNGAGDSQANDQKAPYTVYQQGFPCQATVGVGSTDSTARNIKNSDSIEYSQTYSENGVTTTAVTISCIGTVPTGTAIDTAAPISHVVTCATYDPQNTGKILRGLGETVTYQNGQYQETCNVPAFRQSVTCPANKSCSLNLVSGTSNLVVTANPNSTAGENAGTLTGSVDPGTDLLCPGYTNQDANWFQFATSLDTAEKVFTYYLPGVTNSQAVQLCFAAPYEFKTVTGGPAPAGTQPDGTPGFVGLLAICSDTTSNQPCVEVIENYYNQNIQGGPAGTEIVVHIPEGLAGDPFMHG